MREELYSRHYNYNYYYYMYNLICHANPFMIYFPPLCLFKTASMVYILSIDLGMLELSYQFRIVPLRVGNNI